MKLSLIPKRNDIKFSPRRLKIILPPDWEYPAGSKVKFFELDEQGNTIDSKFFIIDQPMKINEFTQQGNKHIHDGHSYICDESFMVDEEFNYTFDGAKLWVTVQADRVKLGDEFVVPFPIILSHAHCLLLIAYDDNNEIYDETSSLKSTAGNEQTWVVY